MAFYECVDKVKPFITTETVFDNVITFNDIYGNIPLVKCDSLISGYQEGSGTPSPSNVRPLHAFSSGTLTANGNTYTFTFGQSIYQGSIDWKRGVIKGEKIVKTIDENSGCVMSNGIVVLDNFFDIDEDSITDSVDCNCYQRSANRSNTSNVMANNPDYSFCCKNGGYAARIMIKDTRFTTIEDYNSWLSTNPVEIAVKLATPITILLGGIQLLTQQGVNTYSCNTGDSTVEYIKID